MGRHEVVPAGRARDLIAAALQPVVADFEHVRGLVWATWSSDGIRAVIDVKTLKGAQFDITYGVSCDWVPHRLGQTYRWHRTLKQTRLDLWVDHFTVDAEPRQWISSTESEKLRAAFTHARLGDLVAAQRELALVVPSQSSQFDTLTGELAKVVAERPPAR